MFLYASIIYLAIGIPIVLFTPVRDMIKKEILQVTSKNELKEAILGKTPDIPRWKQITFICIVSVGGVVLWPILYYEQYSQFKRIDADLRECELKKLREFDRSQLIKQVEHDEYNYDYLKLLDGDEVWSFTSDDESWKDLCGRSGFVVIRNGDIIHREVTEMN